jgi:hypothetical protein
MQRRVDKIAKYSARAVILIATSAALGWYFQDGIGFTYSLPAFVWVCSCALAIATSAVLVQVKLPRMESCLKESILKSQKGNNNRPKVAV